MSLSLPLNGAHTTGLDMAERALDLLGRGSLNDFLSALARFGADWAGLPAIGFYWMGRSTSEYRYRLSHGDPHIVARLRGVSFPWSIVFDLGILDRNDVIPISAEVLARGGAEQTPPASAVRISYDNHSPGILLVFGEASATKIKALALHASAACAHLDHLAKHQQVRDLATEMSKVTYEDPLLDAVLDKGRELFNCDRASIRLVNIESGKFNELSALPRIKTPPTLGLDEGITGWSFRNNQSKRIFDVANNPEFRELWPGTRSEMVAPITLPQARARIGKEIEFRSKTFGVLNFESLTPGSFFLVR